MVTGHIPVPNLADLLPHGFDGDFSDASDAAKTTTGELPAHVLICCKFLGNSLGFNTPPFAVTVAVTVTDFCISDTPASYSLGIEFPTAAFVID